MRAADENILNSTRSTDFITPKSRVSRTFRDAVLDLAKKHAFARRLVNSGRLSVPAILADSPLNTPDCDPDFSAAPGAMIPGAPAADAPVTGPAGAWLLGYLGGDFTLLAFGAAVAPPTSHPWRASASMQGRAGRRQRDRGRDMVEDVEDSPSGGTMGAGTVYLLRPTSTYARAGGPLTCGWCAPRSRTRRPTTDDRCARTAMMSPHAHSVRCPPRGLSAPFGRPRGR